MLLRQWSVALKAPGRVTLGEAVDQQDRRAVFRAPFPRENADAVAAPYKMALGLAG